MSEPNDNSCDESFDETQDLTTIEERLASFRPRAPRLRLSINVPVHSVSANNASALWRLPSISTSAARCGWVAGVWTCGAVVGALLMYFFVRDGASNSIVDERAANHSIVKEAESPNQANTIHEHIATDTQAIDVQVAGSSLGDQSNMIDLLNSQSFVREDRAWVAGGLLPSGRALVSTRPVQLDDSVVSSAGPSTAINDQTLGTADRIWELEYDSTPTSSRDRLLNELLDHNPAKVF